MQSRCYKSNQSQEPNTAARPSSLKLKVRTLSDNWNKQVEYSRAHIVMVRVTYIFFIQILVLAPVTTTSTSARKV